MDQPINETIQLEARRLATEQNTKLTTIKVVFCKFDTDKRLVPIRTYFFKHILRGQEKPDNSSVKNWIGRVR
jgi:hypothetical protein